MMWWRIRKEENMAKKNTVSAGHILGKYTIYFILVALLVVFAVLSESFFTSDNIINVLRQVSIMGICSVGMTFVILTGGIDLTTGAMIGVSAIVTAQLMVSGLHPVVACLASIAISIVVGFINGFFIVDLQLPPLIVTLGTQIILRGICYIMTGGVPIYGFTEDFKIIGQGYVGIIPIPVIIMAACFAVGIFALGYTKYGRRVYGLGNSAEVSRLSGVNIRKIGYSVYVISAVLSAIAGIVMLSRVNSAQPNAGDNYEMDVITGVVIGGVSINGGEGKAVNVIIGILIIGVLKNGMVMMNLNEYYQWVVKGAVLLLAVSYDRIMSKKNVA